MGIGLVRAPSFKGPYTTVVEQLFEVNNVTKNDEDPCIWRDKRGHFHALFHYGAYGAHAWSKDGISWQGEFDMSRPVFSPTLLMPDGSVKKIHDAERPRIWVNSSSGPRTSFPCIWWGSPAHKHRQGRTRVHFRAS